MPFTSKLAAQLEMCNLFAGPSIVNISVVLFTLSSPDESSLVNNNFVYC